MARAYQKKPAMRMFAIALLLTVLGSGSEAVIGTVRDGVVHHEPVASAVEHHDDARARGDHGHEDDSEPGAHQHGSNHEHGTGSDHCTHVHGVALTASFTFSVSVDESATTYDIPSLTQHVPPSLIKHPPRA